MIPTPATAINRRRFLIAAGVVGVSAACGNGDDGSATEAAPASSVTTAIDDDLRFLQAQFADGFRAPTTLVAGGTERAVFGLLGGDSLPVVDTAPDSLDAVLTGPSGTAVDVSLPRRDAGLFAPHYPLLFEAAEPGVYELAASIEGQAQRLQFMVADRADVPLVHVGDPLRSVDTPTFDNARGVDPICTRFDPCPFHEANLADVIANGRPTALLVATPGFCQTVACGPVVDLLVELDPSSHMNVVHAEVYTEPERINELGLVPELLAPVIDTYQMAFEPSLVVADLSGTVTARIDYAFDRDEIAAALATAS